MGPRAAGSHSHLGDHEDLLGGLGSGGQGQSQGGGSGGGSGHGGLRSIHKGRQSSDDGVRIARVRDMHLLAAFIMPCPFATADAILIRKQEIRAGVAQLRRPERQRWAKAGRSWW